MVQRKADRWLSSWASVTGGLAAAAVLGAAAPAAMGQATNRTVFVGHYFTTGSVASMTVNADGTLALAHLMPVGTWIYSLALSPDGRWLAAASASSASLEPIYVFRVEADASLTLVFTGTVPDSPLDMKWLANDLLAVTQTNQITSRVGIYRWAPDASPPALMEVDREITGGFNSALAYHPGSEYFYTQMSSGGTGPQLNRWLINANGTITASGNFFTGDAYPLNPVMTPRGDMLFAFGGISAGRHALLSFLVSEAEGGLLPAPGMPFQTDGNSPAYSTVTGDGRVLAVGHGTDSTVRTFAITLDGVLTPTGFTFLVQDLQGSIGEIGAINDVVYVTDDFSASDGVTGIYALRVGADGSMTQLAPLLSTGAPRPEGGMAVWNPTTVCPADFDGNSTLNSSDISAFLSRWLSDVTSGSRYADFDASGGVNSSDISAFLAAWLAAVTGGCP